jgi:hypothetical protein
LRVQVSLDADFVERKIGRRFVHHFSRYLPKDTVGRGEASSPDDVIEVVIAENKNSSG